MTTVDALLQLGHELRRALWQDDVALDHHSVTRKVRSLFRCDIDQIGQVLPNCALAIFVESVGEPKRAAVRQRAKAGIKVIEPRINQLDRDRKTTEHFCQGTVRLDIGPKFVAAKEHVAAK